MSSKDVGVAEEKEWWSSADDLEPLIGVPSVAAGPVPLPDDAGGEPEPGVELEQEDAEHLPEFEPPPFEEPES